MAKDKTSGDEAMQGQFLDDPQQGDLFLCEIANWPVKDDLGSMEFPLFSLAKQKDTSIRQYRRGNRTVRIVPSAVGSATMFDKDLLLYIASQIVEAKNRKLPVSRTVQINSIDFIRATERSDSSDSFERIMDMLRRLRGTTIETNIPTGQEKIVQTEGFSMIDHFRVLSSKKRVTANKDKKSGKQETIEVERVFCFTVTISEWLYNGLLSFEVLTLDRCYFKLGRPFDRRLYEIARKHCGDQPLWKINIDLLIEKIGTTRERFKVRDEIRQVIRDDKLPEYRVALDTNASPDDVVFYTRDSRRLSQELLRTDKLTWFHALERTENSQKPAK